MAIKANQADQAASPLYIALTQDGAQLALTLQARLGGSIAAFGKRCAADPNIELVEDVSKPMLAAFHAGKPIIFIGAAGIAIRTLAPYLGDKWHEPPVIALSQDGKNIVPLLGLHHGGAALAHEIQTVTKGHLGVTTAGDTQFKLALDHPPAGFALVNPEAVKPVMAALLAGKQAVLIGEYADDLKFFLNKLPLIEEADAPDDHIKIIASIKPHILGDMDIQFCPQILTLGVGCARNCPIDLMDDFFIQSMQDHHILPDAIAALGTIDLKEDEPAIRALAQKLDKPLYLFSARTLETQKTHLKNPSKIVFDEVGCHGVSEGAALLLAGDGGTFQLEKQKHAQATIALARSKTAPARLDISKNITQHDPQDARVAGSLSLIGIGPGRKDWCVPHAFKAIHQADLLVGYHYYLDQLGALAAGKERADFALGEEEARCRFALEQAALGRKVALISSGDIGIYAMAALVYELVGRAADQGGVSLAAKRVLIETIPGISAFQAAAALGGAPIGHDFCLISLSDLLTPFAVIEQRLAAAAQGDFVIAFYNPVSKSRRKAFDRALEILRQHRPPQTPIMLARQLGRAEQDVKIMPLDQLKTEMVDMFTLVMIGSSQTKAFNTGHGAHIYTPRGYAKKMQQG